MCQLTSEELSNLHRKLVLLHYRLPGLAGLRGEEHAFAHLALMIAEFYFLRDMLDYLVDEDAAARDMNTALCAKLDTMRYNGKVHAGLRGTEGAIDYVAITRPERDYLTGLIETCERLIADTG